MNSHPLSTGALALGCALAMTLPSSAAAADDQDMQAWKDQVIKRLEQLEKSHEQDQKTIEQNQKIHAQDQQEIENLKRKLDETQKTATDAQQKADAAAQVQPIHPVTEGPSATHNFTMVGDAEVQFGKVDGSHSAFALADFAPIFLFRARDNILFEAGFDVTLQNNAPASSGATTSFGLSFATIDYMMNDYLTFVAGDMLLPLGTYSERSAGWLNKVPDDPLPRGFLPGAGVGAQLRGAVPLGTSGQSLHYALYGANGPGSVDGSGNHDQIDFDGNVGINSDGTFGNLHGSPSVGGRVGWFYPFKPHYDIELGLSGQSGTWDNADQYRWSAGVLDAALHIGPSIEFKGEYVYSWQETADIATIHPHGWWIQGSYKLAGLNLDIPYINNLELVGRFDTASDGAGTKTDRYTVGYVYYLTNTLLFEGDYEFLHSNDPTQDHNQFVFQISYGF